MNIAGGEAIARMLKNEGVDTVFGIIDGTYFGFYSNLKKHGIKLIGPRHESSAAHMAAAYARMTGKLGVCMASNGPGVANILPGIAVENTEGNRVLVITSARRQPIIRPDRGGTYQNFDQTGVIRPMSKYSEAVPSAGRLPEIMKQAFRRAWQGRPGVVHVDVPEDIMNGKSEFVESDFPAPSTYRRVEPLSPSRPQLERAVEMLLQAERPVIQAGSGVVHASAFAELKRLAELLHAPVTTSWGARGALCEGNDLAVPMIHIELNDELRSDADLILVLGSRMGETDWWGKQPHWGGRDSQKCIQVDIDDDALGRNKPVDLAIAADVKVFMTEACDKLESLKGRIRVESRKAWYAPYIAKRLKARAKLDEKLEDLSAPMITAHVAATAKKCFSEDSIAVFDGGNAAVWGQFFYKCTTPGSGLGTPKMGMLGAGVGQALGAKAACPDRQVYCIIGDGAMGMHPQELETAVRNDLPVVYLVVCDKQWGMVKMNQQFMLKPVKTMIMKSLGPDETINADLNEIRFDLLAQSMGAHGERVADPKDLPAAIARCLEARKAAVIHIDVDPVKHMWAPGLLAFKEMHQEPAGTY